MFYLCVTCTRNEVRTYEPHSLGQELPRFQEKGICFESAVPHI